MQPGMAIIVEYLAVFSRAGTFLDSPEQFTQLLQLDSRFKVKGGDLFFEGDRLCRYQLWHGEVSGKEQRYFHLHFASSAEPHADPASLEKLHTMLRAVRAAVAKHGGTTETLREDISAHYGRCAYPLIQEVENLMRQLIANFMLITVGLEWATKTLPSEVRAALKNSKRKSEGAGDVLYALDFSHLGAFLFDTYSTISTPELHGRLHKCRTPEDVEALRDALPRSNWGRYFAGLVDCEDTYLKSRWEDLYDLRCKVAHNGIISRVELARVHELVEQVKPKLEGAITKLSKVQVPPEAMEQLAEQAARGRSAALGEFVTAWQELETVLATFYQGDRHGRAHGQLMLHGMATPPDWAFSADDRDAYEQLRGFRNLAVHGPPETVPVDVLDSGTRAARHLATIGTRANYIQYLQSLPPGGRYEALEAHIDRVSDKILEDDLFNEAVSSTNASDFEMEDLTNEGIDFDETACCVNLRFSATGQQDEDHAMSGDRIIGEARLIIDHRGFAELRVDSADVKDDEDEDEDEDDNDGEPDEPHHDEDD